MNIPCDSTMTIGVDDTAQCQLGRDHDGDHLAWYITTPSIPVEAEIRWWKVGRQP